MTSILKVSEIQDPTNSNSALTIDSSGIVTPSKSIGFMAVLPASGTTVATGTYTKISLLSTHPRAFDPQNGWSNTNYYYTIPTGMGGYWLFTAHIEMSIVSGATRCVISTTATTATNSNWLFYGHTGDSTTSSNNDGASCSGIANVSAGTIIKMEGYHTYGSNQTAHGHDNYGRTYLSGWRLG